MTKKIIFQDSFLVSGIMCYQGCGTMIETYFSGLDEFKAQHLLPDDAVLAIHAEPETVGIHRLTVMIESDVDDFKPDVQRDAAITAKFKEKLVDIGKPTIDENTDASENKPNKTNWINILLNVLVILSILVLSLTLPPSLPLTIGLTVLTFITTAITARSYIIDFFRNIRHKVFFTMSTSVTFGWTLSLAHSIYHSVMMPLASSFSMVFMSFIMPVMLIAIINGMDEVKRLVLDKSRAMHLKGIKGLFPQLSDEYLGYQLSVEEEDELLKIKDNPIDNQINKNSEQWIEKHLDNERNRSHSRCLLKKGMLITVKQGECFPVDGFILNGNTVIDASLLTGEPQQGKQYLDNVPAGAINLGNEVRILATNNAYKSTVNQLLFRSNRDNKTDSANKKPSMIFPYLYGALIILGIIAAIATPFALGIVTIPLLLQNITGILFAVCPCTIAIAHQLPILLSVFRRHNKGIILRKDSLVERSNTIKTVVFDKTGTLTTGNSEVDSSEGISPNVWQRVYLLEKHHGRGHPLSKAIAGYYEGKGLKKSLINDIKSVSNDTKNRGLSGIVQGKTLHIGNLDYLQTFGIIIPTEVSYAIKIKLDQGYTPVYVAEDNQYQGVILIKHEIRKGVLEALTRLKKEGKQLIMLTGDTEVAALGFNQQLDNLFEPNNIHAAQTPEGKEQFLETLMLAENSKGVWFIGDGLNDAPCARIVSENGGISCSMTSNDKAAFFTDISLNGSLDYLFEHEQLNGFLKKNIIQNQWLMAYSAVSFLVFIITFSIAGIAVSPLIPLFIMVSTTLFTLFNAYRVNLSVDNALDKQTSWFKRLFASDLSIGLLVAGSLLLMTGVIITTLATGGLAFPAIVFTAGAITAISSVCLLGAVVILGLFAILVTGYLFFGRKSQRDDTVELTSDLRAEKRPSSLPVVSKDNNDKHYSLVNKPSNKVVYQEVDSAASGMPLALQC